MLSRSAQNWNQEFTFDSELAEISGVQNRGIPLFLFFLRSTLAVYIGVIHLFRARSLMPVANSKQEGTRKTRRKRSQQYIIIKLTAIPTIFCSLLSLRFRYIYIYIHIPGDPKSKLAGEKRFNERRKPSPPLFGNKDDERRVEKVRIKGMLILLRRKFFFFFYIYIYIRDKN